MYIQDFKFKENEYENIDLNNYINTFQREWHLYQGMGMHICPIDCFSRENPKIPVEAQ